LSSGNENEGENIYKKDGYAGKRVCLRRERSMNQGFLSGGKLARRMRSVAVYGGIVFFILFATIPLIWMILTSIKPAQEVMLYPPTIISKQATLGSYVQVWHTVPFGRFILNSLAQTLPVTLATLFFGAMMGYIFSKHKFPGRDLIFMIVLSSLMVPIIIRIIPLYLMVSSWGWIDTYWALIIPELTTGFAVFLLRQFIQTIPDELIEAAKIDGASEFRIFFTIIIPLIVPALAAMTIFRFMYMWNYFLWPLVVIQNMDMRTLPLGLALFQGRYTVSYQLLMAASVISILPVFAVFLFFQRHFIRGIALTGIKA